MSIGYNKIDVGVGNYKLSPSQLTVFYRNPKEWMEGMNNKSRFSGNIASIKGTCVHYMFESHFDERTKDCYWQDVKEYLLSEVALETINTFESDSIMEELTGMYDEVMEWITDTDESEVVLSEPEVKYQLPPSIVGKCKQQYWIAGSIDAIIKNDVGEYGIRDYKTSSRKASSLDNYIHQLVTYAIAWNNTCESDMKVTFVEIVNIYPTKTKGRQFNVIRKYISDKQVKKMETIYKEIVLTHKTALVYPQLENLLYREGVSFMGAVEPLGD